MSFAVDQLLTVVAVASLGAGGWALAGRTGADGLMRGLAAAALASAAAIIESLALGVPGWGGSAAALAVAAVLSGGLAVAFSRQGPRPSFTLGTTLTAWWRSCSVPGLVARGALAGALTAALVWILRYPGIGVDSLADHLALPVQWVQSGHPGRIVSVNPAFSFANWPISHEVLVAWTLGLSHNLVAAMVPTPATYVLLLVSVRAGLGTIGVPARRAWLACAVAGSLPILVVQLPGPNNDLPVVAWTACTAALLAGARRRPGLAVPAIVAAGLAIGTKTTPVLLLAVILAGGLWPLRRHAGALAKPGAVGLLVAVACGGLWYLRNLFDHGSPLWPLQSLPGGDPVPPALRAISPSFLGHLSATLHGRTVEYWDGLGGGLIVVAGALLAPLWRGRRALPAAALVLAAALLWAASPYTGNYENTTLALGAVRYLLPTLVSAAVILGAGRGRDLPADLVLAAAVVVDLVRYANLGFPAAPGAGTVLAGAAIGALGAAVVTLRPLPAPGSRLRRTGIAILAAALGLALLVVPAGGFMAGHADTGEVDAALVRWLQRQPAYRHGSAPVAVAPASLAVLAGPRLTHRLTVVAPHESCVAISTRLHAGWLVVARGPAASPYIGWGGCLRGLAPRYLDGGFAVFSTAPGATA